MPPQIRSVDELDDALSTAPPALPVEVLEWLSDPLLYCAAPPYATRSWESG